MIFFFSAKIQIIFQILIFKSEFYEKYFFVNFFFLKFSRFFFYFRIFFRLFEKFILVFITFSRIFCEVEINSKNSCFFLILAPKFKFTFLFHEIANQNIHEIFRSFSRLFLFSAKFPYIFKKFFTKSQI